MNEQEIVRLYTQENLSTYIIAEMYGTYPNKIKRVLNKLGIELNSKSTAQKIALKTGRTPHPTKGEKRSQEVKEKISEGVYKNWKNISEKEYQKRVDRSKAQWYNMTEQEREALRNSAALAVRAAARDGSKMEKFLAEELPKIGYEVIFHKVGLIPNDTLEVDLFLPGLNTVIEIDGPSHFYPIWGEENLQRHINADSKKSGLLLAGDFAVIRIKHLVKNMSEKHKRDILNSLSIILKQIENKFPPKGKRYIELEVNDEGRRN